MRVNNIKVTNRKLHIGFEGIVNSRDEGVLDTKYAKYCRNFAFDGGVLTGGIGIDEAMGYAPFPSNERHAYPAFDEGFGVKKLFLYRRVSDKGEHDDRLLANLEDGTVWYTSVFAKDTWHKIVGLVLNDGAEAVNYNLKGKDVILLTAKGSPLFVVDDATPKFFSSAPKFTSIAVHNERVYGSVSGNKTQLWFSDDFDPSNWSVSETEAGYINFADEYGEIIKLIPFSNYLFVFREYGIFRLTAYGDQSDFLLKKVFTDTSRIYKDSIVLAGDKILFCAENGAYAFDGYNFVRIGKELPEIFDKNTMCAGYLDDTYYIACKTSKSTESENDTLVFFNTKTSEISMLSDVGVRWLCPIKVHNGSDMLCAFWGDNKNRIGMTSTSGKVLERVTKKVYKSPSNILLSRKVKTVRNIKVLSKYPIVIRTILDGKVIAKSVGGKDTIQTVHVERCGSVLSFEIESVQKDAYIAPLEVSVDLTEA